MSLCSVYVLYKLAREMFWVERTSHTIGTEIKVKTKTDREILAFLDPISKKIIEVKNLKTKSSLIVKFESLESETYFFIDTAINSSLLIITDKFAGANKYDLATLKLIGEDCFKEFGGYNGCNDSLIQGLRKPILIIK